MLADEIQEKSKEIYKEAYQMSIGELANLYRDGELDIHPEFQRVFRWSDDQKSRLIESIMLNIPIPQIFVNQAEDGTWDVIDGVQRLSTIFQFMNILKDEEGKLIDPLVLRKTKDLPSFDKMMWNNPDKDHSFTKEQQLELKRSRIDVVILKKSSDPKAKYELFQRLNTGGTHLSSQEIRNCLIIMANREFYNFIKELDNDENYKSCVPITDRKTDEQYRLELINRLLVANSINWNEIDESGEIADLLDYGIISCCNIDNYPYDDIKRRFFKTFAVLNDALGEDSFRRYYRDGDRFRGAFSVSAFDAIAFGVFKNIDNIDETPDCLTFIKERIKNVYSEPEYISQLEHGVRATTKFKKLSIWGENYFHV